MKQILRDVWQTDKKNFLLLLILNIGVAITSSFTIVILIPLLDLLNISAGDQQSVNILLRPFVGMSIEERAIVLVAIYVGLTLLRAALTAIAAVRQNVYMERYQLRLRKDIYDAIGTAGWETFSSRSHSDIISLLTVQCGKARACLQGIVTFIASFFSALMQLMIALWMSWPLTLAIFVVGGGFLIAFRPLLKKSKEYGKQSVTVNKELHEEIRNQLNSIKEIRAYGAEEHHEELFENINKRSFDIHFRTAQLRVVPQFCYSIGAAILIALAFVFNIFVLKTGTAQLVILVYVFARLWPVFSSWQGQLQGIQSNLPAYETICQCIEELSHGARKTKTKEGILPFEKEVTFRDVCFTYQNGDEEVLTDINFTLPCGSVTALVGRSGAGKSTTADLLLGLLQPTSGSILIDGQELTQDNMGSWRKAIGYIPQEPLIINATVRENLLRFHPDATEEEVIAALKKSLAWPFVEKLPKGLDTVLGDKGTRLSGGERQRIVLARVLIGKPRLIILDEATSALDYESESFIRETIRSLRENTTVLVIAHRMATIRGADRAIVLQNGKLVEQGTLQELLDKETGYLSDMVSVE
ncbi:MAG: ABC transporter ATP-binding protein [Ruminococcaceae bacterium]|nr:ABC transporter ATP-binding protein [Oscillospiraceae bacterium]